MKKKIRFLAILFVLLGTGASIVFYARGHKTTTGNQAPTQGLQKEADTPVAQVQAVPIERKSISEKLTAYGSVVAQPGKTHFVAISFESNVRHILVTPGQQVKPGDILLEIQGSPASLLQLHQAENSVRETKRELEQAKQRFDLKLATNQELYQAQKAFSDAELQLESLKTQGVGSVNTLRSDIAGVVAKVDVEDGQVASAGSPLVELIAADDIEIKLGIEPEDVSKVEPGQRVSISIVNSPSSAEIAGTIRLVTQRVNPADRLVDLFVSVPAGTQLLLAAYVRGEITVASHDALVVPRDAVIPDDGGHTIYLVHDNRALKKIVKIGLQSDDQVEIIDPDLHDGDQVVTLGNRELTNEMEVRLTK